MAVALVLSGGNALGAFQAGAWERLEAAGIEPGHIAGTSTGAVNGAIIAGNPPGRRVERLRHFWNRAAEPAGSLGLAGMPLLPGGAARDAAAAIGMAWTMMMGRPGFFAPNLAGLTAAIPGSPAFPALFDLGPLRASLAELVDFERLNAGPTRLTIVATDLENGGEVRFDNRETRLTIDHILASSAFLPAFPPVEIGGRLYGDGGFSANLPLGAVLDGAEDGLLCIAVDLFRPEGHPRTLPAAQDRNLDLFFASQTHAAIIQARHRLDERRRLRRLAAALPAEIRALPGIAADLADLPPDTGPESPVRLLHLVHRPDQRVGAKMFDFAAASLLHRWRAGVDTAERGLAGLSEATGGSEQRLALLRVESAGP
ncbi:MAG TPA: patatin-like phospholipase family protein [Azospirillaceae bacterium]|nr:patatin-like phospholipase family protein [Azospirillaceae bacterium]